MNRRFDDDTNAVSTAVGAILLVTIVFIVILAIQTSFVPRWEEEAEERHSRIVQREFLDIVSQMEQRASNTSAAPATLSLTMDDGGNSIFSLGAELPGELLMSSEPFASTFSASEMAILSQDGISLAVINETWIPVTGTHSVTDLIAVDHLRVRIANPASAADGDSTTVQITDANGQNAGTLTVYIDTFASGYAIKTLIETGDGTDIYDDGESRFQQDAPSLHHTNALEPSLFFANLLAAAESPFSLDMTESGLAADMSLNGQTSSGSPISGASTGPTIPNILRQSAGGQLELTIPNNEFPQQTLIMDHGGVVIQQSDGVAFLEKPAFEVGPLAALTEVKITDTVAGGTPRGVSSHSPVRVTLSDATASQLEGSGPDATWNVTTPWPALWQSFWDDTLSANGWDDASGHYSITTGDGWARLDLDGIGTDGTHDLSIRWTHATITTTLET